MYMVKLRVDINVAVRMNVNVVVEININIDGLVGFGCWLLDGWLLAVGCWLLGVGCLLLAVGCWLFVACNVLSLV